MTDLEKKMEDALITCHVLLTLQWNELGRKGMRCRSAEKCLAIITERDQVQVARKAASEALRAISPTRQTHHSTWESKPIAPL
jgi:hypothetical protein